jgi:hypothetical protein
VSHLRKQIRDRLSGTTLASLTTTGTRVYVGRATPLAVDASPSLLIDSAPSRSSRPRSCAAASARSTARSRSWCAAW